MRANIYSLESLTVEKNNAVTESIEMVVAYMGNVVTTKECRLRGLTLSPDGKVDPARIGLSKLDKLVELHLMAVPLKPGEDERLGIAGIGQGWGFVDSSDDRPAVIRSTTSHEVAHAFGFVIPGAIQEDKESSFHCCDEDCIMYKCALTRIREETPLTSLLKKIAGSIPGLRQSPAHKTVSHHIHSQYDFCLSCKIDLRDKADEHLSALRLARVVTQRKIKWR